MRYSGGIRNLMILVLWVLPTVVGLTLEETQMKINGFIFHWYNNVFYCETVHGRGKGTLFQI